MKRYLLICLLGAAWLTATAPAQAQSRRPAVRKAPAPVEEARRVDEEEKPAFVIREVKVEDPVLVFYQQAAPTNAVEQLLMSEKNLALLKTVPLEELVARREVFIDGLGNYAPPAPPPTCKASTASRA